MLLWVSVGVIVGECGCSLGLSVGVGVDVDVSVDVDLRVDMGVNVEVGVSVGVGLDVGVRVDVGLWVWITSVDQTSRFYRESILFPIFYVMSRKKTKKNLGSHDHNRYGV